MSKYFTTYNKESLFNKIDKISIEQVNNQIITKYDNIVRSIANVSKHYEIFDIKKYLKERIEFIEKNFNISKYNLVIKSGRQELTLLSDIIDINGTEFNKSFFILNSSDKSRRLSFNSGLFCNTKNFYTISSPKNISLNRKHLKGVTKLAEEASDKLNDETFSDQINFIKEIVNHKISLSNLKNVIVPDPDIKVNHLKFDSFKNHLSYFNSTNQLKLTSDQVKTLRTPSSNLIVNNSNDFYLDAFLVFQIYLRIFSNQDSHLIQKETERIMNITQYSIRNRMLESIGI